MKAGSSTAHMFKTKWKNFTVELKNTQTNESETISDVWAINKDQAGFLAFRKTRFKSCSVEKVEEINKVAS